MRSPKALVEASECYTPPSLDRATAETKMWKARYKEAVSRGDEVEKRLEVLQSFDEPNIHKLKRIKPNKSEGVAVIAPASDWHVEEQVTLEGSSGTNFFDLKEAERRIQRFYQKVLELIDWQNGLAKVSELWHPLLGDLLTGYIHEELMETNSLSPTEACSFLQDMICSGIDLWLRETKLPILIPTCVGNHGRTTIKKRIKTSHRNSFEWLLYTTLAKRYASNNRVAFFIGKGYHNTQTIVGRLVRFHHGDGLRYCGGMGGITLPVNRAILQWDRVQTVDLDVFGHFHQFLWHYNKWIACGSLMGYTDFSVSIRAEYQRPTQTFIVLDRRYGVTCAIPVFLTDAKRE